jgi:energy-coupling factor transport system substrate-specific component
LPSRLLPLATATALAALAVGWAAVDPGRGALAVLLAALATIVAGAAWLERDPGSVKDLTLVATLGGLGAAGRVLFAPIPNVQPLTFLAAASGVALGPRRGFAVGAVAALASNFFLGQGPHTPWQMPMDLWHWYGFLPDVPVSVVLGAGFAFNLAHAIGNAVIAFAAGPEVRRVLERYDRRLRTEIAWA